MFLVAKEHNTLQVFYIAVIKEPPRHELAIAMYFRRRSFLWSKSAMEALLLHDAAFSLRVTHTMCVLIDDDTTSMISAVYR